eukprot:TRINITY_DN70715_c0_g1_i1.p2 TRINITY_DN70715_c0_g1~~TRINITY_DN70715_c0_g1_i1.p2  ORF type:complete len:167 (+),score=23.60 TRINITY_DN70715_c0_g1_i1:77-577(+)
MAGLLVLAFASRGSISVEAGVVQSRNERWKWRERPAPAPASTTAKASVFGDEEVEARASSDDASVNCSCNVQGDSCICSRGCDRESRDSICIELLGRCTCAISMNAYCECSGYCPTVEVQKHACRMAPGCGWNVNFCDSVTNFKYNVETEKLEAAFPEDESELPEL